jgi:hypothetical protein
MKKGKLSRIARDGDPRSSSPSRIGSGTIKGEFRDHSIDEMRTPHRRNIFSVSIQHSRFTWFVDDARRAAPFQQNRFTTFSIAVRSIRLPEKL